MNIDFHTHVKLSKKTRFSLSYMVEMIQEAKASGLHALAVTEHFNTLVFDEIYEMLDQKFPYHNGYYEVEGVRLFPGIEVDIQEGGHILIVGDREDIVDLRHRLSTFTEEDHFVSFETLLNWADEYNVLKIGAHPFRDSTPLHQLDKRLLRRLDAFDLNGKDLYARGPVKNSKLVNEFAAKIGIPVVGGSDTHQYLQYGSVWNSFAKDCSNITELKEIITRGKYEVHISPCLDTKVKSAVLMKKLLKREWKDLEIDRDNKFAGEAYLKN